MKKVFLFAVAAAALVACSNEELSTPDNVLTSKEAPVSFDVYTQRSMTRAGVPGTNDNANIGTRGFGVFAYYTAGEQYDAKATPNFMYNQQVTCTGTATPETKWTYEPVKYWPNEFGAKAISDEVDYLTFFAYAPWTNIDPTTGNVIPDPAKDAKKEQTLNIISVNKNTASGDPIIKYVVDTDPATSVDLLWGVAADNADKVYTPIDGATGGQNANVAVEAGKPFLNLVKPNNPQSDRLMFNLKHALAKVKVTIDYIADDFTPAESYNVAGYNPANAKQINAKQTRIYVRSFKMSGFATKGALNLNNTNAGEPLWKDFDGVKDLAFDDITFQDGRKDGKEGETNGAQNNETPQGLNPNIIENYCQVTNNEFSAAPAKTSGVTEKPQLLFGGTEDPNADNGFFYVIPRNEDGGKVDVTIAYDVETIDPALAGKLSDNETHGISIENVISKLDIFGGLDFKAGYQYEINIHLGMTSVKVEATVTDWKDNGKTDVELPDNQEPYMDYYWKIGDAIYTSDPTEVSLSADKIFIVDDEASFNAAYAGPLGQYYNYYHAQNNAWYDPDPVTGLPSWTGLSTVEHNPAAGFGLPWVVIDLTQTPTFKGTLSVKYDGQDVLTDWAGRTSNDGSQNYVIIDATDFTTASAPATGVLTWNANASVWEKPANYAKWDVSKIEVILKRNDVKKYSYTTGQEVNP